MKKRGLLWSSIIILALAVNQIYYLKVRQFRCADKIERNVPLNHYEILSALQTHSDLWLFGWMINKNAAHACFCKQFHIQPFINFDLKEDSVVKKTKQELMKDHTKHILLQYKSYHADDESIILNGSTMTYHVKDENDPRDPCDCFDYWVSLDYKPGTINIAGITIVETVFDYLENIGVLDTFTHCVFQEV